MAPGSKLDSGSFERRAALRHSLSSLEINMSMQQHADQLIEHIGNNFRVFMPLDSAPKSRAEFDSQLKQVFTATVDVPALREYLLKRFTIYSNSLWERYSALVNKSVKGSKKSHDISLLCTDKEFDTAVDRIEAGSINDADAFSRLLITPGAPASVATSYLHSRLSKQINAAEYVPTLAATSRTYGVAQITDIIEMAQHFLSDVKVHASLITRAPQIASFVSLCMFRFQQCAEYSAQARSRFAEALTCLCCEEFTLDFEEAEQSAAKSVDSDSDSDDESAFNKSSSASSDSISQQRIDSFLQSLSAYLSASSSATSGALARRVLLFTERFRHLIHQCIEDDHEFANFAVDLVLNVTDQAHRRRLPSQPVVMLVHALFQSIDTDSLAAPMVFVKCAQFGRHSATLGAGTLNKWKRLAALVAETLLPRLDRVPIPAPLVAKMSALRAQRLSDLITSTKVTDDTIESLMALVDDSDSDSDSDAAESDDDSDADEQSASGALDAEVEAQDLFVIDSGDAESAKLQRQLRAMIMQHEPESVQQPDADVESDNESDAPSTVAAPSQLNSLIAEEMSANSVPEVELAQAGAVEDQPIQVDEPEVPVRRPRGRPPKAKAPEVEVEAPAAPKSKRKAAEPVVAEAEVPAEPVGAKRTRGKK